MAANNFLQNRKLLGSIVLIIILFSLYKFSNYWKLNGEMHYSEDPYIDTQFTENFTFEKFDKISKGMSQQDVVNLIGEPFSKGLTGSATYEVVYDRNAIEIPPPDFTQDCWSYSRDGKLGDKGDTSWYSYVVCFKQGQVESTVINEFFD